MTTNEPATEPPPQPMSEKKKARSMAAPRPKRRRRLGLVLLGVIPALFLAGTAGAFWTGYSLYDRPFVWYNTNRIAATADRAGRGMGSPVVVALGGATLRHATLDEDGMAKLAARDGIERVQFLRIVHEHAQFADFEPMLGAILKIKPDLVLLDLDLLFAERRPLADLRSYGSVVTGMALEGKPYLADQIAIQYEKPCRAPDPNGRTAADVERRVEEARSVVSLDAESTAFEAVRRFADQARAGGTRVALLHLRRPTAFEERMYGPGNSYLPAALTRLNEQPGLPVWRFPDSLHKSANYCRSGALGPEGRKAYSQWLSAGIAQVLSQPRVEEAALR
ncbi:hypothetical protein [Azospirillum rugosum]|uniref:SGNH/GDSL hydrolase family protein n=1 Tax=Azospirillum rugosum TaxID=416170 RepID=A0ABS4SSH9_9PROT|nr:hypothetical protein [Azospirillum rugosum]MBP2295392.1 hypothetical protein [Azospirillum rugosum]MDQ0528767.1 hypothetical protein [Azospirillum rugosum]